MAETERRCPACGAPAPAEARFCMRCGAPLPPVEDLAGEPRPAGRDGGERERRLHVGLGVFLLTLLGTLAISAFLMFVLGLPVFVVGAVLPLLWFGASRR